MDTTLFNKNGEAAAYITSDYNQTIYIWEGIPVAYIYNEEHVYGVNGRHLGWFINGLIYNHRGERVGFTYNTCPVPAGKEPVKPKKYPPEEVRPRWAAPPLPKLMFSLSDQDLDDLLREGEAVRFREESPKEETQP